MNPSLTPRSDPSTRSTSIDSDCMPRFNATGDESETQQTNTTATLCKHALQALENLNQVLRSAIVIPTKGLKLENSLTLNVHNPKTGTPTPLLFNLEAVSELAPEEPLDHKAKEIEISGVVQSLLATFKKKQAPPGNEVAGAFILTCNENDEDQAGTELLRLFVANVICKK